MQIQNGGWGQADNVVKLQCEGGEKEHKQQSLQSAVLWCGNSFCVSSVKHLVLHQAIMKQLCRKLNVWEGIKIADLLPSVRREAVLEYLGYEAASPHPKTICFQRILKIIHIYLLHID